MTLLRQDFIAASATKGSSYFQCLQITSCCSNWLPHVFFMAAECYFLWTCPPPPNFRESALFQMHGERHPSLWASPRPGLQVLALFSECWNSLTHPHTHPHVTQLREHKFYFKVPRYGDGRCGDGKYVIALFCSTSHICDIEWKLHC